ncbi:endonuclease/exonuclease/phosphatase family protein [Streptomyces sp. NPDC042319]|uniref:endonuclease/exonuclease/phosphatase family protein n=1 Tax=Streptomyces sp. NPDC042319 TaxID=3154332 RepID=UPI0033DD7A10
MSRRLALRAAGVAAVATVPIAGGSAQAAAVTARTGAGEAAGRRLRAMTFNLRYASDERPHSWAQRRPVMRELLRREAPHLLGTQEGLYGQLQDVAEDLGARYSWLGTGRAGGSRDEFAATFYDTRRLRPVEYDHFWLSDTPYLIGSATWGNTVIRMVTWVRFRDLAGGGEFYALNTHLDHAHQGSRERSAGLITERLRGMDAALPRVVMGDFNVAAHRNPVYETMLRAGSLVDSWDAAEERSAQYATFHGYRPLVPDGDRVDWLLTSPSVRTLRAEINVFAKGGQYPSDHLPVQAVLDW